MQSQEDRYELVVTDPQTGQDIVVMEGTKEEVEREHKARSERGVLCYVRPAG